MKFPVRRCRKAALVMTLLVSLTICSAASFLPETHPLKVESDSHTETAILTVDHRNTPRIAEPVPEKGLASDVTRQHAEALPDSLRPELHEQTWLEEDVPGRYGITLTTIQLYPQPDEQVQALRQIETGKVLTIAGEEGLWYQVTCDGLAGYVPAENFFPNVAADATLEKLQEEVLFAAAAIPVVSLWSEPEGELLAELALGDGLQVLDHQEDWTQVEFEGLTGYVLTRQIALGAEKPQWVLDREAEARQNFTDELLAFASAQMGEPYRYGKAGPDSFDCSGFTTYVFKEFGISLARTSNDQRLKSGTPVEGELLPGDLVFFSRSSSRAATHVGIYLGGGQFIHASSGKCGVTVNNLTDPWYVDTYVGANRVY